MKLYHGTSLEAAKNIVDNGFILSSSDESNCDRIIDNNCGYGFDNFEDAESFALDQGYDDQAVICIDVQDPIEDPEYDGEAYYFTEQPKNALMVWSHKCGEEINYKI